LHESLTNDLDTDTGSEADTWTLLSDTITNCTEQKHFWCFLCDPLQLRQTVWSGTLKPTALCLDLQLCTSIPPVCTCCYSMVPITNITMCHTICGRPPSLVHI